MQVRKKEKAGWKAGRKEGKSQVVYFSHMRGATPSRRIPTKLGKCVRLTDVIKHAKFHRYNLRGFGAVRCWCFHVAIGTHFALNTLLDATTPQVTANIYLLQCHPAFS